MSLFFFFQIACAQEYLMGGIFLLLRSKGIRSRKLLGTVLVINSINVYIRTLTMEPEQILSMKQNFLNPVLMTAGGFIAGLLLLYILEVIRPGWISWKKCLLVVAPCLIPIAVYRLTLFLLNEPIRTLSGTADLMAYIGEFNVWFRFVLIATTFACVLAINWFLSHYQSYYNRWCEANYANTEKMDISWIKYFGWGLFIVTLLYYCLMFNVWEYSFEVHQVGTLTVVGYLIYKGMFHVNPYPEKYFAKTMDETEAAQQDKAGEEDEVSVESFRNYLPEYVDQLQVWMVTTQPYLRKDFKLIDVSEILPLNRTYLSRVFNEGLGGSFSQVVQNYRVKKALDLLGQHPPIRLEEIASRSGFASLSTFYSVFQKQTGMSPKRYRDMKYN